MVFIFHQIKSSLNSGCSLIPLYARFLVCLRMWECVGVRFLFCFLQSFCRPSPDILQIAACKASVLSPAQLSREKDFPPLRLQTRERPLSSSKAASKNRTCMSPDPLATALQHPSPSRPKKVPAYGGRMQKLGAAKGSVAVRGQAGGAGSTEQQGTSSSLPAGKRPLAKGRNPPVARRVQPMPFLRLLRQREGG